MITRFRLNSPVAGEADVGRPTYRTCVQPPLFSFYALFSTRKEQRRSTCIRYSLLYFVFSILY